MDQTAVEAVYRTQLSPIRGQTFNREIEHLGIVGLANLLLRPIDIVLEIAYLDRSPGN
ncbi:hypothetical protein J3F83DRAFT_717548 [Trichoderma novae-zelandiae]